MAQWVKAWTAHGYLSLIPRAHIKVEEKNTFKKSCSDIHTSTMAHTHSHSHPHVHSHKHKTKCGSLGSLLNLSGVQLPGPWQMKRQTDSHAVCVPFNY